MDFKTTEASEDLGGLVRSITESVVTPERQKELDKLDERFDRELWDKLIDSDILSTTAPESVGGGGFGPLEQSAVLVALGRQLAAVPYLESTILGAGAIAEFGSAELQSEWAAPAVAGSKIVVPALDGEMGQGPVQATGSDESGYKLTGTRTQVAYGPVADAFVEVDEITLQGEVKRIFSGWMFAASPGLHGVERLGPQRPESRIHEPCDDALVSLQ